MFLFSSSHAVLAVAICALFLVLLLLMLSDARDVLAAGQQETQPEQSDGTYDESADADDNGSGGEAEEEPLVAADTQLQQKQAQHSAIGSSSSCLSLSNAARFSCFDAATPSPIVVVPNSVRGLQRGRTDGSNSMSGNNNNNPNIAKGSYRSSCWDPTMLTVAVTARTIEAREALGALQDVLLLSVAAGGDAANGASQKSWRATIVAQRTRELGDEGDDGEEYESAARRRRRPSSAVPRLLPGALTEETLRDLRHAATHCRIDKHVEHQEKEQRSAIIESPPVLRLFCPVAESLSAALSERSNNNNNNNKTTNNHTLAAVENNLHLWLVVTEEARAGEASNLPSIVAAIPIRAMPSLHREAEAIIDAECSSPVADQAEQRYLKNNVAGAASHRRCRCLIDAMATRTLFASSKPALLANNQEKPHLRLPLNRHPLVVFAILNPRRVFELRVGASGGGNEQQQLQQQSPLLERVGTGIFSGLVAGSQNQHLSLVVRNNVTNSRRTQKFSMRVAQMQLVAATGGGCLWWNESDLVIARPLPRKSAAVTATVAPPHFGGFWRVAASVVIAYRDQSEVAVDQPEPASALGAEDGVGEIVVDFFFGVLDVAGFCSSGRLALNWRQDNETHDLLIHARLPSKLLPATAQQRQSQKKQQQQQHQTASPCSAGADDKKPHFTFPVVLVPLDSKRALSEDGAIVSDICRAAVAFSSSMTSSSLFGRFRSASSSFSSPSSSSATSAAGLITDRSIALVQLAQDHNEDDGVSLISFSWSLAPAGAGAGAASVAPLPLGRSYAVCVSPKAHDKVFGIVSHLRVPAVASVELSVVSAGEQQQQQQQKEKGATVAKDYFFADPEQANKMRTVMKDGAGRAMQRRLFSPFEQIIVDVFFDRELTFSPDAPQPRLHSESLALEFPALASTAAAITPRYFPLTSSFRRGHASFTFAPLAPSFIQQHFQQQQEQRQQQQQDGALQSTTSTSSAIALETILPPEIRPGSCGSLVLNVMMPASASSAAAKQQQPHYSQLHYHDVNLTTLTGAKICFGGTGPIDAEGEETMSDEAAAGHVKWSGGRGSKAGRRLRGVIPFSLSAIEAEEVVPVQFAALAEENVEGDDTNGSDVNTTGAANGAVILVPILLPPGDAATQDSSSNNNNNNNNNDMNPLLSLLRSVSPSCAVTDRGCDAHYMTLIPHSDLNRLIAADWVRRLQYNSDRSTVFRPASHSEWLLDHPVMRLESSASSSRESPLVVIAGWAPLFIDTVNATHRLLSPILRKGFRMLGPNTASIEISERQDEGQRHEQNDGTAGGGEPHEHPLSSSTVRQRLKEEMKRRLRLAEWLKERKMEWSVSGRQQQHQSGSSSQASTLQVTQFLPHSIVRKLTVCGTALRPDLDLVRVVPERLTNSRSVGDMRDDPLFERAAAHFPEVLTLISGTSDTPASASASSAAANDQQSGAASQRCVTFDLPALHIEGSADLLYCFRCRAGGASLASTSRSDNSNDDHHSVEDRGNGGASAASVLRREDTGDGADHNSADDAKVVALDFDGRPIQRKKPTPPKSQKQQQQHLDVDAATTQSNNNNNIKRNVDFDAEIMPLGTVQVIPSFIPTYEDPADSSTALSAIVADVPFRLVLAPVSAKHAELTADILHAALKLVKLNTAAEPSSSSSYSFSSAERSGSCGDHAALTSLHALVREAGGAGLLYTTRPVKVKRAGVYQMCVAFSGGDGGTRKTSTARSCKKNEQKDIWISAGTLQVGGPDFLSVVELERQQADEEISVEKRQEQERKQQQEEHEQLGRGGKLSGAKSSSSSSSSSFFGAPRLFFGTSFASAPTGASSSSSSSSKQQHHQHQEEIEPPKEIIEASIGTKLTITVPIVFPDAATFRSVKQIVEQRRQESLLSAEQLELQRRHSDGKQRTTATPRPLVSLLVSEWSQHLGISSSFSATEGGIIELLPVDMEPLREKKKKQQSAAASFPSDRTSSQQQQMQRDMYGSPSRQDHPHPSVDIFSLLADSSLAEKQLMQRTFIVTFAGLVPASRHTITASAATKAVSSNFSALADDSRMEKETLFVSRAADETDLSKLLWRVAVVFSNSDIAMDDADLSAAPPRHRKSAAVLVMSVVSAANLRVKLQFPLADVTCSGLSLLVGEKKKKSSSSASASSPGAQSSSQTLFLAGALARISVVLNASDIVPASLARFDIRASIISCSSASVTCETLAHQLEVSDQQQRGSAGFGKVRLMPKCEADVSAAKRSPSPSASSPSSLCSFSNQIRFPTAAQLVELQAHNDERIAARDSPSPQTSSSSSSSSSAPTAPFVPPEKRRICLVVTAKSAIAPPSASAPASGDTSSASSSSTSSSQTATSAASVLFTRSIQLVSVDSIVPIGRRIVDPSTLPSPAAPSATERKLTNKQNNFTISALRGIVHVYGRDDSAPRKARSKSLHRQQQQRSIISTLLSASSTHFSYSLDRSSEFPGKRRETVPLFSDAGAAAASARSRTVFSPSAPGTVTSLLCPTPASVAAAPSSTAATAAAAAMKKSICSADRATGFVFLVPVPLSSSSTTTTATTTTNAPAATTISSSSLILGPESVEFSWTLHRTNQTVVVPLSNACWTGRTVPSGSGAGTYSSSNSNNNGIPPVLLGTDFADFPRLTITAVTCITALNKIDTPIVQVPFTPHSHILDPMDMLRFSVWRRTDAVVARLPHRVVLEVSGELPPPPSPSKRETSSRGGGVGSADDVDDTDGLSIIALTGRIPRAVFEAAMMRQAGGNQNQQNQQHQQQDESESLMDSVSNGFLEAMHQQVSGNGFSNSVGTFVKCGSRDNDSNNDDDEGVIRRTGSASSQRRRCIEFYTQHAGLAVIGFLRNTDNNDNNNNKHSRSSTSTQRRKKLLVSVAFYRVPGMRALSMEPLMRVFSARFVGDTGFITGAPANLEKQKQPQQQSHDVTANDRRSGEDISSGSNKKKSSKYNIAVHRVFPSYTLPCPTGTPHPDSVSSAEAELVWTSENVGPWISDAEMKRTVEEMSLLVEGPHSRFFSARLFEPEYALDSDGFSSADVQSDRQHGSDRGRGRRSSPHHTLIASLRPSKRVHAPTLREGELAFLCAEFRFVPVDSSSSLSDTNRNKPAVDAPPPVVVPLDASRRFDFYELLDVSAHGVEQLQRFSETGYSILSLNEDRLRPRVALDTRNWGVATNTLARYDMYFRYAEGRQCPILSPSSLLHPKDSGSSSRAVAARSIAGRNFVASAGSSAGEDGRVDSSAIASDSNSIISNDGSEGEYQRLQRQHLNGAGTALEMWLRPARPIPKAAYDLMRRLQLRPSHLSGDSWIFPVAGAGIYCLYVAHGGFSHNAGDIFVPGAVSVRVVSAPTPSPSSSSSSSSNQKQPQEQPSARAAAPPASRTPRACSGAPAALKLRVLRVLDRGQIVRDPLDYIFVSAPPRHVLNHFLRRGQGENNGKSAASHHRAGRLPHPCEYPAGAHIAALAATPATYTELEAPAQPLGDTGDTGRDIVNSELYARFFSSGTYVVCTRQSIELTDLGKLRNAILAHAANSAVNKSKSGNSPNIDLGNADADGDDTDENDIFATWGDTVTPRPVALTNVSFSPVFDNSKKRTVGTSSSSRKKEKKKVEQQQEQEHRQQTKPPPSTSVVQFMNVIKVDPPAGKRFALLSKATFELDLVYTYLLATPEERRNVISLMAQQQQQQQQPHPSTGSSSSPSSPYSSRRILSIQWTVRASFSPSAISQDERASLNNIFPSGCYEQQQLSGTGEKKAATSKPCGANGGAHSWSVYVTGIEPDRTRIHLLDRSSGKWRAEHHSATSPANNSNNNNTSGNNQTGTGAIPWSRSFSTDATPDLSTLVNFDVYNSQDPLIRAINSNNNNNNNNNNMVPLVPATLIDILRRWCVDGDSADSVPHDRLRLKWRLRASGLSFDEDVLLDQPIRLSSCAVRAQQRTRTVPTKRRGRARGDHLHTAGEVEEEEEEMKQEEDQQQLQQQQQEQQQQQQQRDVLAAEAQLKRTPSNSDDAIRTTPTMTTTVLRGNSGTDDEDQGIFVGSRVTTTDISSDSSSSSSGILDGNERLLLFVDADVDDILRDEDSSIQAEEDAAAALRQTRVERRLRRVKSATFMTNMQAKVFGPKVYDAHVMLLGLTRFEWLFLLLFMVVASAIALAALVMQERRRVAKAAARKNADKEHQAVAPSMAVDATKKSNKPTSAAALPSKEAGAAGSAGNKRK